MEFNFKLPVSGRRAPVNFVPFGSQKDLVSSADRSSVLHCKMSTSHLTTGSPMPAYAGKLRVYSMRFCPFAQRVILMLRAKNVDYEVVNINLTEKPEWYTSKSPLGKVPALEVAEDVVIYESLVTADYVEEKYPQNPLTSNDPLRRAQDKLVVENFNKPIGAFFKIIYFKQDTDDLMQGLHETQNVLIERGTEYFHGDEPGMVDYMIWPWFERFDLAAKFGGEKYTIDKENEFKTLYSWVDAMKGDQVVQHHYLDLDTHEKFSELRIAEKNAAYDILEN